MIYKDIINQGDLVFDVGANNGNRVDMFLNLGAKVVAIEPQEKCVNKLKNKYSNNASVQIVSKAVGAKEGVAELFESNADTISSMNKEYIEDVKQKRFASYSWGQGKIVETTTLDKIIEEYGIPSFIKIDVEGYELEVLKGLSTPIKMISLEYMHETHHLIKSCMNKLNVIGEYQYAFSLGESLSLSTDWMIAYDMDKWLKDNIAFKSDMNGNFLFGDVYARQL